nr:hypothetical protein [Moraxella sp. CTOTU46934]
MIHKSHNLKIAKTLALSTVLGISLANGANAAEALSVNLQAKQIVTENGKQVLKTVNRANSGDIIQYQAIYRNNIQKPMTDLALTLPVPANMVYVSSSSPAPTQASLDGKKFENLPIMRKVNGKMVEVPVSQYRALRWIVKTLPAQQSTTVSLNAKVQ